MDEYQQINIDVPKDLWKQFGIACTQLDQTRKESIKQALEVYLKTLENNKKEIK